MAITLTNSAYASENTVASNITKSFGWTATAGRLLVAACNARSTSGTIATPSGWTLTEERSGAEYACILCYKVASGSETTLTVTTNTSSVRSLAILEFSGCDASPADAVGDASFPTSTSHTVTCTSANSIANELVVATWALNYGNTSVAGATIAQDYSNFSNTRFVVAYKIVSAIETSSLNLDTSGYSPVGVGAIGTYKMAGSVVFIPKPIPKFNIPVLRSSLR